MSHFARVIRIIKTVMMGWAGYVFRVEVTNAYSANTVAKKLKERDHFRYMSMIILKLNETEVAYVNFFQLAQCRFE